MVRHLWKVLDLPPVWLAGFLAVAYGQKELLPLFELGYWARLLGDLLVGAGLFSIAGAALQMVLSRTTFVPKRDPAHLVTSGFFRMSRNPIYLGDAMVLAGLSLRWDAVLGLALVPVFMAFIDRHFIRGEEARIRENYGDAYYKYTRRTRRWI